MVKDIGHGPRTGLAAVAMWLHASFMSRRRLAKPICLPTTMDQRGEKSRRREEGKNDSDLRSRLDGRVVGFECFLPLRSGKQLPAHEEGRATCKYGFIIVA